MLCGKIRRIGGGAMGLVPHQHSLYQSIKRQDQLCQWPNKERKKEDARSWEYLRNVKELGGLAEAYHP